ncbi:MAG: hypothetical protein ABSA62_12035, partial [Methyloceanibacter sp.]
LGHVRALSHASDRDVAIRHHADELAILRHQNGADIEPKPWEIEGMSKRTWYRRKANAGADKAANGTGPARTETTGTGFLPESYEYAAT